MRLAVACVVLVGAVAPAARADFDYDVGTNLGSPPNSTAPDFQGCLTADELQVFFVRLRDPATQHYDILTATRGSVGAAWSSPVSAGSSVNTSAAETSPVLSADGLRLYFARAPNPTSGPGAYDIMVSERASTADPFGSPSRLDFPVNTMPADEQHFALSGDELTIVFSRRTTTHYDLFEATRPSLTGSWTTPVPLGGAINTTADDEASYLTPDGLRLFFASDRAGHYDIYVAERVSTAASWSTAAVALLGGGINTPGAEYAAWVSPDGARLYFSAQNRTGAAAGNSDLMLSVRLDAGTDCEGVLACVAAHPEQLPPGPQGPPGPPGPALAGNAVLIEVASLAGPPPAAPAGYAFAGFVRLRGEGSLGRPRRAFAVYLKTSS